MKMEQLLAYQLAELNAISEKMDSNQEEMKANQAKMDAWLEEMAWQKETMACQEGMEASREKLDAIAEHQEDPKEEAAVETWSTEGPIWGSASAVGHHQQPKKCTQGDGGFWKKLAAAHRHDTQWNSHLMLLNVTPSFIDPKSIISMLNFLHLRFFSV
ncbi:hypothetical protein B7P43_G15954 [Cryptotermes secundus]|uniref:Uncharacterized protein n=1 Tax=Cryptotermes secundus TaxID=105785 RepID=A0A2J7RGL3_9NEOP|nr:hypothetical protein B7P43_G15954 [Cryptotermes secundus]